MKRTVLGTLLAAMLVLQPLVASALEADLSNDTTGAGSTNANTIDHTGTVTIIITNTGTATNDFDLDLNTGGNTIENNTTVGDVSTGDINFDIVADSTLNNASVDLGALAMDPDVTITSENHNTGSDSTNTNVSTTTNATTVTETNTATVNNTVTLALNTGGNTIENNTTVGDISTGDITGSIKFTTQANGGGVFTPAPGPAPQSSGTGGGTSPTAAVTPVAPQIAPQGSGVPLLIAQAKPVEPAKELMTPRKEFFPAGGALPSLAQLLGMLVLSALLATLIERVVQILSARRFNPTLYRLAAAVPLI